MAGKNENKINICFVAPLPPPYGGIANWTAMMCRYLDEEKADDICYTVLDIAPKKNAAEGRTLWNRVIGGGIDMLRQRSKLKKILQSEQVDVIHMITSGSFSVIRDYMLSAVAKKYSIPLVYHIHFGRIPELQRKGNLEWKIIRSVMKRSQTIIAIDKKTYDCLYHLYADQVVYIPNPIYLKEMPVVSQTHENTVMYLGWVIKEKGIEELLEAWMHIYEHHTNWKLQIVGPYKAEYYEYLQSTYDLNGIDFMGEQPHGVAMDMMNRASVFVLPSHSEGCPYVILEAMALGKAIVATDVGNIPEMLSGGCGTVIPVSDTKKLQDALLEQMENMQKRGTQGANAREKACSEYEISKIVTGYWSKKKIQ
jgi:glycosyltransferase involved in cell wall biosynthesis